MARTETSYEHIVLDEANRPIIEGTRMKVIELVLDHLAYNWGPDELHRQHPHLTMGQIYSALAFYADHKDEFDREIEHEHEEVRALRRAAGPSPFAARLKTEGHR